MSTYQIIPEIDVLVATTKYLVERHVKPYKISIPKGKGIDYESDHYQIFWKLIPYNIRPIHFEPTGQDIIGISKTEWWQVECKGSGEGKKSTYRTNFDRALASVVSYYEENTKDLPKEYKQYKSAKPYLGLALPSSPTYLRQLEKRVRQSLRKRLNLWILLYEHETKSIKAVSPEDCY